MGEYHNCCLDEDRVVHCWGDDGVGQVSGAPEGVEFFQLALGYGTSCGLVRDDEDPAANGTARCWGSDDADAISGVPAGGPFFFFIRCFSEYNTPFLSVKFTKLSGVESIFCGLDRSSSLPRCWGDDSHDQIRSAPCHPGHYRDDAGR